MTIFLETADGGLINADEIVQIKTLRDGEFSLTARLRKGGEIRLGVGSCSHIQRTLRSYAPAVAAAPGWYVLSLCSVLGPDNLEEIRVEADRTPIVAWQVDEGGVTAPVTYETLPDDYAILSPSGEVVRPEIDKFDNETKWLTVMQKEKAERAEAERAKAEIAQKRIKSLSLVLDNIRADERAVPPPLEDLKEIVKAAVRANRAAVIEPLNEFKKVTGLAYIRDAEETHRSALFEFVRREKFLLATAPPTA